MGSASPRALTAVRQAAVLLRAARDRVGTVIRPRDAADILVAGDLHGNLDNFRKILAAADLAGHPRRHLVLQEFVHGLGRYPDGSDNSHRLLEAVCALIAQFPHRVHPLLGNHEHAEWIGRAIAKDGVYVNALFEQGVRLAHGELADEMLAAYKELYAAMPLAMRTESRVFLSHSIPSAKALQTFDPSLFACNCVPPDQRGKGSSLHSLLWGRDASEATAARFCQLVDADLLVTGHLVCEDGMGVPNRRQLVLDASLSPAGCVLIPASGTITHEQLVQSVLLLK